MVGFRESFSRFRYAVYLDGVQRRMPNSRSSFDVSVTLRSGSDTTFSNYLLIVDAYSKIPKLYGMEKITTEEVMDKR